MSEGKSIEEEAGEGRDDDRGSTVRDVGLEVAQSVSMRFSCGLMARRTSAQLLLLIANRGKPEKKESVPS